MTERSSEPERREVSRGRYAPHAKEPRHTPDESAFELSEDDEEFQELVGTEPLADEAVPADEQTVDVERAAAIHKRGGPPGREGLEVYAHERGQRFIEGATETEPLESRDGDEGERYAPADRQLDIRHDSRLSGTKDTAEEGEG